jgi:hypothetical protein
VIDGLRSSDGQRSIDTQAKSPNDANLIQSILFDYYYLSRERAGAFEIDFFMPPAGTIFIIPMRNNV